VSGLQTISGLQEKTYGILQKISRWNMVAIQDQQQFTIGMFEGIVDIASFGTLIFSRVM